MAVITPQQQMVNALRIPSLGAPAAPAVAHPNYVAPVANLNPNLPKAAARVQQVATGQAKPNSASWG